MKLIRILVDTRCDLMVNENKDDYLSDIINSFGEIDLGTTIPFDETMVLEKFGNLGIQENTMITNNNLVFSRISNDIISLENDDGDILYGKIIDTHEVIGAFIKASSYYRVNTFEYVVYLKFT